jgi:hypothetical protein
VHDKLCDRGSLPRDRDIWIGYGASCRILPAGSREANPPMLHVPNIPVFQVQDGAPKMAKLRYKWLNYVMVYGRYNCSIHGVYKLTKINLRGAILYLCQHELCKQKKVSSGSVQNAC